MDLSTFHTHRHHSWRPQWFSTFNSRPTGAAKWALAPATRKYAWAFLRHWKHVDCVFPHCPETLENRRLLQKKRLRAVVTTPTSDRRRPKPPTPSEASEYKLKLRGIDRRAPPGERPAASFGSTREISPGRTRKWLTDWSHSLHFAGSGAWPFSVWWSDLSG